MKLLITLFLVVGIYARSNAQLSKVWDNRFGGTKGDALQAIIETSDHGFLLGGFSGSDSGFEKSEDNWSGAVDFWVIKTDSTGLKLWDKRFGGFNGDFLEDAVESNDGGFLLGGWSVSDSGGNKSQHSRGGGSDYWVIKIDNEGNYQWDKTFGGSGYDVLFCLTKALDGGYLLAGYSESDSSGDKTQNNWGGGYFHDDVWIVKIDSVGNKQWDRRYGGDESDGCRKILQTKNGGYLLSCTSTSDSSGDKSQNTWGIDDDDYWLIKIDANGNKLWDKDFGGLEYDLGSSMSVMQNGTIVIVGQSNSLIGGDRTVTNWGIYPDQDFWIVMLDSNGNKIWDQHYGGISNEYPNVVKVTSDDAILVTGYSNSGISGDKTEIGGQGNVNAWMIKFDTNGVKQWDKTLVNDAFNGIGYALETNDGGFVIGTSSDADIGGDKSQDSRGESDYFFAKFKVPIQFSSDTSLCQKDCILFNNLTYYSAVSWQWLFPGGTPSNSTQKDPLVCYNTPGLFDVTLIAFYGGKYDTLTKANFITVNATPITPVITQLNDTLICSVATSYQWYLNQLTISGATDQTYATTQQGNYSVEIKDENGCSSFSENFEVNVITPLTVTQFQIFPNPTGDFLNVNFLSQIYSTLELKISNPLGQLLLQSEISNGKQLQIPVSVFNGSKIVLCQLLKDTKLIEIQKILIEK
ncbi:MAG: hypothetical protein LH473_02535 [Chitinophagales bacterium]|nr:hypothetical protein [Chitinophagales bacterium]